MIGSLFAGHLGRVAEVSVLCRRDEHARALNEHGLRVTGRSDFVTTVQAATDPAELPEPDLGIVATKATELEAAAERSRGHLPGAAVMTVQNGLGAEEAFAAPALAGHLGGHVHERHAPLGHPRRVHPRHRDLARPLRGHAVRARRGGRRADRESGLNVEALPDLRPAQWSKLIFNATVNAVAALTGLPHDPHFAAEAEPGDLGHLVHDLIDEGKARRRGRRESSCTTTHGR